MPANLNALLRYRTIDSYLHGNAFGASIEKLIDLCSNALTENRGKNTTVSERTIRDDIRVMRSDMLGFNAPIFFESGKYHYDPKSYTIAQALMPDSKSISDIYHLLILEQRGNESELLGKAIQLLHDLLPDSELQELDQPVLKEEMKSYESIPNLNELDSNFISDASQSDDFMKKAKKSVHRVGRLLGKELPSMPENSIANKTAITWEWLWQL